jgi:putative RNA 2'-phosphotransferase
MMTEKEITRISKFLSLVLRHQPELIGIELDKNGWVEVRELLKKSASHGTKITREILEEVVVNNSKKRFAFSDNNMKIRASQGHSVEIDLGYEPKQPPDLLYHGSATKNVSSILKSGLEKQSRSHVHLSADKETAIVVGKRHGEPVIFEIAAARMFDAGQQFFLSANGVWLTDSVPAAFLTVRF